MKLIIGLGNPEKRYDHTRHNIGFFILDSYKAEKDITFQKKDTFKAEIAKFMQAGEKVILAKPMTYYNLSGEAVRAISDFHKIQPEDTLIIHDELMLPFGTIRTRLEGADAGNNGLRSIVTHIGSTTARLRFGIDNELRAHMGDVDFVLGKFSKEEQDKIRILQPTIHKIIDSFIAEKFFITTHR